MPFEDLHELEMEKTSPITTLAEARAAMSAIDALSHDDRANDRYDRIREMQAALDKRFVGSGFSIMYSQQEQMYILY